MFDKVLGMSSGEETDELTSPTINAARAMDKIRGPLVREDLQDEKQRLRWIHWIHSGIIVLTFLLGATTAYLLYRFLDLVIPQLVAAGLLCAVLMANELQQQRRTRERRLLHNVKQFASREEGGRHRSKPD